MTGGRRFGRRRATAPAMLVALVALSAGMGRPADARRADAATATAPAAPAAATCAPLDVALVLDTSTSMDPAIANVKAQIAKFTEAVEAASGGDYRIGLIDFAADVTVHVPFSARNAEAVRNALPGLRQTSGNSDFPEAWDEALVTAVDGRKAAQVPAGGRGRQIGDFAVPWRAGAKKMIVLVTDARPAGFDDQFGADDLARTQAVAVRANAAGIRIPTVFVPNGNQEDAAIPMLREVAETTGSRYFQTQPDGANLTEGVDLAVRTCALDSDGDGLFDEWETNGYDANNDKKIDVDLPALGADPKHKDLFIQVNWMADDEPAKCYLGVICTGKPRGDLSHEPDPAALKRVADSFAAAPVDNPDKKPGIKVHFDAGDRTPKGLGVGTSDRHGGPLGSHQDFLAPLCTSESVAEPAGKLKATQLSGARADIFTWVLYADRIGELDDEFPCFGIALGIPSDTVVVGGEYMTSTTLEAVMFAHELGHTLGLRHGGVNDRFNAPNYLSIMNYVFAFNGGLMGDGRFSPIDYSRFDLEVIDENALDEKAGIKHRSGTLDPKGYVTLYRCANGTEGTAYIGGPVDWNCDLDTDDGPFSQAIHRPGPRGLEPVDKQESRNDWATLSFVGGSRGGLLSEGEPIDDSGLNEEAWRAAPKEHAIALSGPGPVSSPAGTRLVRVPFVLENFGTADDAYKVAAVAKGDWTTKATTRSEVELSSGTSVQIPVDLAIPEDADVGDRVDVVLTVTSQDDELVAATESATVIVGDAAPVAPAGPLTVTPRRPQTRQRFELAGEGFAAGGEVIVTSDAAWFAPIVVEADDDGAITVEVTAPGKAGATTFSAVGTELGSTTAASTTTTTTDFSPTTVPGSGADLAAPRVLEATVTVIQAPRPPGGFPFGVIALVLAVAVVVGLVAFTLWQHARRSGS